MIPDIFGSSKCFLQISAIVFQSFGSMSSESFMNGFSIIGLQISFSSGAISRRPLAFVGNVPPDFGSILAEIVPPVMTKATLGSFCGTLRWWDASLVGRFAGGTLRWWGSSIFASKISDSLIPML